MEARAARRLPEGSTTSHRAWSLVDLLSLGIIVCVVLTMVGREVSYAWARGLNLSEIADSYGEANDIRAGEAFADHGFGYRKGLPEISYGTAFESAGGKHDQELCMVPRDCVYLHNPPGSAYTVAFMTKLFGKGAVFHYRLLPLGVGLLAFSFLAYAMAATIGVRHTAAVYLVFLAAPMFANMMHGLCYHGYALSLCLAEIGVLLLALLKSDRVKPPHLAALGAIAFVAGWFCYEYVFVVAFTAVPVWLLREDWRAPATWRGALMCVVACCAGFGLAQVLHLVQVSAYLGGFSEALADLAKAGRKRTGGATWMKFPVNGTFGVIFYYWFDLLPKPTYLNFSFVGFVGLVTSALALRRRIRWPSVGAAEKHLVSWEPAWRYIVAIAVSILISSGWMVVMQQHAGIHGHFLPRLYFLVVIIAMLAVSRSLNRQPLATPDD
ncbi:MAG: hypothetical protein JNL38_05285 [Myxococcales bacterium]|nr:hypothetical protein [Myxococcales bacterium]